MQNGKESKPKQARKEYAPVNKAANSSRLKMSEIFAKSLGVRSELEFIHSGYVAYPFFIDYLRSKEINIKTSAFQPKLVRALLNGGKVPKFMPKKASYYDFTEKEIEILLEAKAELCAFYKD
jgi:hypothetical protein